MTWKLLNERTRTDNFFTWKAIASQTIYKQYTSRYLNVPAISRRCRLEFYVIYEYEYEYEL